MGLRFVREMEQGKQTLRMDKVNQVLFLFGFELGPVPLNREKLLKETAKVFMDQAFAGLLAEAMKRSKPEDRMIMNKFRRFEGMPEKWNAFTDISFLPAELKQNYKDLIRLKAV